MMKTVIYTPIITLQVVDMKSTNVADSAKVSKPKNVYNKFAISIYKPPFLPIEQKHQITYRVI